MRFNPPGDVPGSPVQFESDDMGDPGAGYGFESDHTYEGDWFFFHTDHLGSTSYLTDTAGNVSQFVCYTPYGEAIVDEHLTTYENPFKFSGKELDDITGLYDHGARSRNPISTLWYGVDKLFEKYREMGPYVYCAGNPVKLVDPDGRKVRFAEGVSEQFKKDFKAAIEYLNKHGCGDIFARLEQSEEVIYINEVQSSMGTSKYSTKDKTIYWNSREALETDNGNVMSPASILNHEADHAEDDIKDHSNHIKNMKEKDESYDNKEERRVIRGSEQKTARKTGELRKNTTVTRRNHSMVAVIKTNSPISTKGTREELGVTELEEIKVQAKVKTK